MSGPTGWVNDPQGPGDAPNSLIIRTPGLDGGGPVKAPPPPMHEADQENMAFLHKGIMLPPVGNCGEHLKKHADFGESRLGKAMPEYARDRLREHMIANVHEAVRPARTGASDFQSAGKLASMALAHEKGERY